MTASNRLYDFTVVLPFNAGPVFPELKDKTVGELSNEQARQAHEDWIRAQFGHMADYYRPHLALLLHVIDGLRAVGDGGLGTQQLAVRISHENRRLLRKLETATKAFESIRSDSSVQGYDAGHAGIERKANEALTALKA